MTFDPHTAAKIATALEEADRKRIELPDCCVANCSNGADPRYGIRVGEIWAPACDGHGGIDPSTYLLRDPLPCYPMSKDEAASAAAAQLRAAIGEVERLTRDRDSYASSDFERQLCEERAAVARLTEENERLARLRDSWESTAHKVKEDLDRKLDDADDAWHDAEKRRIAAERERSSLAARLAEVEAECERMRGVYEAVASFCDGDGDSDSIFDAFQEAKAQ